MNLKLNLVSACGRHARQGDSNVRLAILEAFAISLVLAGIYFAACAIQ